MNIKLPRPTKLFTFTNGKLTNKHCFSQYYTLYTHVYINATYNQILKSSCACMPSYIAQTIISTSIS